MDKRFKEIFDNTVPHSSFLSENSIMSCMYQSYQIGVEDLMTWLVDNKYLNESPRIIENEFHNREKNLYEQN